MLPSWLSVWVWEKTKCGCNQSIHSLMLSVCLLQCLFSWLMQRVTASVVFSISFFAFVPCSQCLAGK